MFNRNQKLLFTKSLVIGFLVFSVFVFRPNSVSAASVYLTSEFDSVAVGDTVIADVMIDSSDKVINAVEGDISIEGYTENIEFSRQSVAGSVFKFWPQTPSIYNDSLVSFVGGVPDGFNQKSGLLFKIIFLAKKEGQVVFQPKNIKAYENDGKGTSVDVLTKDFVFEVMPQTTEKPKNEWLKIISEDKNPPQNLIATFGQDPSIFEGKKIISISADDTESGMDYFEVKEGNRPGVRTGDIYVLLDQDESSLITITAYDKAGNRSQVILNPIKTKVNYLAIIFELLIVVATLFSLAFLIVKLIKKRKKI